jgi:hypothetical protein
MSEPKTQIKTTGQLREFLVNMLVGVKNGQVEESTARSITKMAAQVNESFYSEVKIAKFRREAGETAVALGQLPINS